MSTRLQVRFVKHLLPGMVYTAIHCVYYFVHEGYEVSPKGHVGSIKFNTATFDLVFIMFTATFDLVTCQTTIIFGTMKDYSLAIHN